MTDMINHQKNENFKITLRYHFTCAKMAIIKKQRVTSISKYVDMLKPLYVGGGHIKNGISTLINSWKFLKMLNRVTV